MLAARRQFGNTTLLQEDRDDTADDSRRSSRCGAICRHAARMLRKNPRFAAARRADARHSASARTPPSSASVTPCCSKPLPYTEPDRIVMLWERMGHGQLIPVSPANFVDWRRQHAILHRHGGDQRVLEVSSLTGSGEPVRLSGGSRLVRTSFRSWDAARHWAAIFCRKKISRAATRSAILAHAPLGRALRRRPGHSWHDRHAQRHQLHGCRRAAAGISVRGQGGGLPGAQPGRRLGAAGAHLRRRHAARTRCASLPG